MRQSKEQYAPWISDPDPPGPLMSEDQIKRAAEATAKLVRARPPKAPKPANSINAPPRPGR
jgi:hypothetical protein